ncbi:MAG: flippase [Bacteroidales bacterium]|nr:flippase [Bacteroidales bacterium]MBN2757710.1 flippase [Bacteroidales bacterium]
MLKQKFILSYGSKMFMQFVTIAASIVVARVAGPTVMGTIAYALAYVQMLGFVSDLGLGTAHIKLISEGRDEGKCNTTFAVLKTGVSVLFIFVFFTMFLIQKYYSAEGFESQVHEYVIYIFIIMLTIQNFLSIPITTFAAKIEQAKQDIPYLIRGILFQLSRIVIVLLGGKAISLAFGNLAASVIIAPVYLYLFRKYPFSKFDKELAKEYIKMAAPILILGAATTLTNTIDKVLLQFFTDSEQVGYYAAGFRIGGFILLISRSMSMLFFPMFSKAVANRDFNYIRDKIVKFEKFSFLFIMPIVVLICLYAEDIVIVLLGKQYIPSINIMAIITVAMFINVFSTPYGNLINGFGRFKLTAKISVVNLLIYVIILLIFLSKNTLNAGPDGVAWSLLITNVLLAFTFRYYAKKDVNSLDYLIAIKFIIFGIINYLISYYVFSEFFYQHLWTRLSFFPIYLVFTYALFHLLKWMNKEDWKSAINLFDFKAMKNYISGEMKGK